MSAANGQETIANRLVEILRRLNAGDVLNPHELVTDFKVSFRTIQRDLNTRFSFLPLKKEKGLYSLDFRQSGMVAPKELGAIISKAGIASLPPTLLEDFICDLKGESDRATFHFRTQVEEHLESDDLKHLMQLRNAVKKKCIVSFQYFKTVDDRHIRSFVKPYALISQDGIWYLAAVEAKQLKAFSVAKIDRLLVSEDHFECAPEILQILSTEDSIWLNVTKKKVLLLVSKSAAIYFKRQKLLSQQKLVYENADGSIVVSTLMAHPEQLFPLVRQWLPHLRILEPKELQIDLNLQLQAYLQDFEKFSLEIS